MTLFAPLIILLTVALYGLIHSIAASLRAKALARRSLGPAGQRYYRLGFNLFAGLSLLPVLALAAALPDQPLYAVPAPARWLLLAIQGLAALALLVGVWQTGLAAFLGLDAFIQTERPNSTVPANRLVTSGLYHWVRHPLYTAGLIFMWASPVMTANLLALFAGFSLYLFIGAWFEERKLLAEFGADYAAYQQRTPGLIPFWPVNKHQTTD